MIKLQAREIIRAANRLDIKMKRGDIYRCALGVIYLETILASHLNVKVEKLEAIEAGFKGWQYKNTKSRYYKVGQRVAELAGLPRR